MMNKLIYFLVIFISTVLVSCSNSQEKNMIDVDYINYLSRDGSAATYELADLDWYEKTETGEWQIYDDILLGYNSAMPSTICFQNGKIIEPLQLSYSVIGPNPLQDVWQAYCYKTKTDRGLYISSPLVYNEESNTLYVRKKPLDVLDFTEKRLELSYIGHVKEHGYYKRIESIIFGPDNAQLFESEYEAYKYIAEKCRELFGKYLNLNVLYADWVILDDPIVYMDDVDAWVEQFKPADE